MILLKNKFILTITCDKNDADYLTKTTVLDAVHSEYFNPELFIKTVKVLQKIASPDPNRSIKLSETYKTLKLVDIEILYDYDTYGQDPEWILDQVAPLEKYSILDYARNWDSQLIDLFPMDTESPHWNRHCEFIHGCHTVNKVELIHIDENGLAYQI